MPRSPPARCLSAPNPNTVQLSGNPVQISSAWIGKPYDFQRPAMVAPSVHTPYPNSIGGSQGYVLSARRLGGWPRPYSFDLPLIVAIVIAYDQDAPRMPALGNMVSP